MAADMKLVKVPARMRTIAENEVRRTLNRFQERDQVAHRIRSLRLMRHNVYVPKSYQRRVGGKRAIKLPIMYRLIQTAVAAVAKQYPKVFVEPFSNTDKRAAEDLAEAYQLLIQTLDNMYGRPFLYTALFNLFGDGLMVLKTQVGAWGGFPLPNDQENPKEYTERVRRFIMQHPLPFVSRVVDPLTFYPPLNEYGGGVVLERSMRSTEGVLLSLGLKFGVNNSLEPVADREELAQRVQLKSIPAGHPYSELELPPGVEPWTEVSELWDDDGCLIIIKGAEDMYWHEYPMGEKPYNWGYADPTGVEDPTNVGMSIAYPLYYLAPWIDTMAGVMAAWSLFAAPTPYTTQDPVPGMPPVTDQKVEVFRPGKMYHFPTGRRPGVLEPPGVGRHVLDNLNFLIQSADRGGLPALVSGSDIGGRLPALTFQAAFEAATDRLRPAVQSAENVFSGMLHKVGNIAARYEMPIKVNGWEYAAESNQRVSQKWSTIKPKEAGKGRRITVSLAIDSTQDLIAKGSHATVMQDSQLWGPTRAMRFAGVQNVEEEKADIAAGFAFRQMLPMLGQLMLSQDPEWQELMAQQMQMQGGEEVPPEDAEAEPMADGGVVTGEPPGIGRNRSGPFAPHRGGRPRGHPTHKPPGNRKGKGRYYGRS